MADKFTETKTTGYGSRIVNSLGGIIFGIILFLGSFVVLYLNEGRSSDYITARLTQEIGSAIISQDKTLQDKPVSATGIFNTTETIGDNLFLKPGAFIAIKRRAETYAWQEEVTSSTKKNLGGSETTETTYNYTQGWDAAPRQTSTFKHAEGHENLQPSISNALIKAQKATLGAYAVDPQTIELPSFTDLKLTADTIQSSKDMQLIDDRYIFVAKTAGSTYASPKIGDMRISYQVVPTGKTATVFGKLDGDKISSYFNEKNKHSLYRAEWGSRAEALGELKKEQTLLLWILRLIGVFMMWLGLNLVFAPISVILDVLPWLGSLSQSAIALMLFAVALALTALTIFISMITHNFWALMIIMFMLLILGIRRFMRLKKEAAQKAS